jgi:ATP-binding cassette subfamily B protein
MLLKRERTTKPTFGLRAILKRAVAYWRPYWVPATLIMSALLLFELFNTLFALSFKLIIDGIQTPTAGPSLNIVLVALAGGFILAAIAAALAEHLTARTSARILNDLRLRMFAHLQQLSLEYYNRSRMGDILARFSGDLVTIEQGLTRQFMHGCVAAVALVINLLMLFYLEWRLALVTFAAWPLIAMLLGRLTAATSVTSLHYKQNEARMLNTVQESVRSQAVVKAFGFQSHMLDRMRQHLLTLASTGTTAFFFKGMVATSSLLSVLFIQMLVTGVGAWLATRGYLSIGTLIAFLGLLTVMGRNAYELSKRVLPDMVAASGGLQRLEELLAEVPSLIDAPEAVTLPRPAQEIRFDNVSFSYSGEQPTLDHLTLCIQAGQYVAIVGPSGSGKSTLLNLLTRFYDVDAGQITLDGYDIREVTQASLRTHMGVVFQESFLFDTTIRENLRLARPTATDDEIETAARAAEIHTWIMGLPQGYDTMAGAAGGQLSGGQRQRLALARALLRDPALLLLDEPTSALDATTEAAISATLAQLARERTVIMSTHRLAAVVNADRIFVLEAGHLVEVGTHAELLARRGLYYDLWQKQQSSSNATGERTVPIDVAAEHLAEVAAAV